MIEAGLKPGWTARFADRLTKLLAEQGGFETRRVTLRAQRVEPCAGCALCLERGEDRCKNRGDDAAAILGDMLWADGIVVLTPNYSMQASALFKHLSDRLAFLFHRPRLFGRFAMAIVVQGVYGGKKVAAYLDELMAFWGCTPVKGAVLTGAVYPGSPQSGAVREKNEAALTSAAQRLAKAVNASRQKAPTFFRLAIFRATRTGIGYSPEALEADKRYFTEQGWLKSAYYTPVRLGPVKAAFGAMIDGLLRGAMRRDEKKKAQGS